MTSHAAVSIVQAIHGTATVQRADGRVEPLKVGDAIYPGDQVLATQDGSVELRAADADDQAGAATTPADAPAWNPAPSAAAGAKPGVDALEPILRAIDRQDPEAVPAAGGGDAALADGLRVGRVVEGVGEGSLVAGFANGTPPTLPEYPTDPAPADPAPPSVAAGSSSVVAREQGVPVGLNLPAPTWNGSAAPLIEVVSVPSVGQVLTAAGVVVTAGTALTAAELQGLVYRPPTDYRGEPVGDFVYSASSGELVATGHANIALSPVNDLPVALAAPVQVAEDTAVPVSLAATDVDGVVRSITVTSVPEGAHLYLADGTTPVVPGRTLSPEQAASLVFVPAPQFNGVAQIGFTATDDEGGTSSQAWLPITVTPVQDAPAAAADAATTSEDSAVSGNVISGAAAPGGPVGRDFDADGDSLRVTGVSAGAAAGAVSAPLAGQYGSLVLQPDGAYLYTPGAAAQALPAGASAVDTFSYTVSDGAGGTAQATLTINLTGTNDAAVISGTTTGTVTEDAVLTASGRLTATDIDDGSDGDAAFVPASRTGAFGTLALAADGTWTYVLNNAAPAVQALTQGDVRSESFQVFTTDGTPQTLTITLHGSNDAPTVSNTAASGMEDASAPIAVTLLGRDMDGAVTGYTLAALPAHGTLYLDAAGTQAVTAGTLLPASGQLTLYFQPTPQWNGATGFDYVATDDQGASSSSASAVISIVAVNDPPVAADDAAATPINVALSNINVLGNDRDVEGQALSVTSASVNPAQGSVSVNPDGTLNFTPAANVSGPVNVSYSISDGNGGTATATLVVNVGPSTPPTGTDATQVLPEDGSAMLLPADFGFADADAGQVLAAVRIDTLPAGGALTLGGVPVAAGQLVPAAALAAGQLVFTPVAQGNGNSSFNFSVQDSAGSFDTTPNTHTFTVTPVNDAPLNSVPAAQATGEDTPLVFSAANGNRLAVTDVDGDVLTTTLAVTSGTLTLGGTPGVTVSGNGTGTVQITGTAAQINAVLDGTTFRSAADAHGPATLTMSSSDGTASHTATVALAVTAVADIVGDGASTDQDNSVAISVLANDSFEDAGRVISAVNGNAIVAGGAAVAVSNGMVTLNASGQLVFAPTPNASGPTSFTYTVASGGVTETATVNVTVGAVSHAPVNGAPGAQTTAEDSPLVFSNANGNALSVADVDGGTLTSTLAVSNGTLSLGSTAGVTVSGNGTGSVQITGTAAAINAALNGTAFSSTADYNGAATLTVTTSDGAASDMDSVALTVSAVADIALDAASTNEGSSVGISVLANDGFEDASRAITEVNGSAIVVGGAAVPVANGTVTLNATGQLVFAPTANYNGTTGFTYTVASGGVTETASVNVSVGAVNDIPVNGTPSAQTTAEDSPLIFSSANGNALTVSDLDGGTLTTTLAVTHGTLMLGGTAGVTVSGNGTGSVQITGTAAAINAALNGAAFTNTADHNGAATLTVTTSDGAASDIDSVALTISAVADIDNDAATVSEDSAVAISVLANDSFEDAGRVISAVNGSAITAGGAAVAVANGTVTLNAAGQLVFAPTANHNGPASFTYTVASGGVTETATVDVTVNSVNDGPVNTTPGAQTAAEDSPLVFSSANGNALTVSDVDGGALTSTLAVTNGTLTLGSTAGVTVSGNGTGSVQVTGTAAAINAALNGTTFTNTADYNGAATLTVTTSDGAATDIDSVALTVAAVADISDDSASTNEDSAVAISVLANDSFESAGRTITEVNGSAITAGGAAVAVANGTVTLNVAGQLVFAPTANYNGPASFTYTVSTGGVNETAAVNVTVSPVNDDPVNTTPGAQTTAEDSPLVFSSANGNALTVADADGGTLTTTIAVTNGLLTLGSTAGVTITGNGTGSVQITGTAAAINAALNGTTFNNTADYNGAATLTVTTSDGAATDIDSVALTISAVADIANDAATVNEDNSVAISVLANDSFEAAGRVISAVNGSAITAGGAAVAVSNGSVTLNAAGQLVFAPTANYNGPASFTYTVASGGVTETATVNVTVNSVNDGPVNTTPGAQSAAEDSALTFSSSNGNALSVADVDGGTLTTTLAVSNGTLTLGGTTGVSVVGNGTGSVQLTGTAAAINAALNGTAFINTADYNGAATLTVTTSDGAASYIDSVALTITAVADIANDSATVNEDSSVAVSVLANDTFEGAGRAISAVNGNAITAGGAAVAVANGSVSLNATGQLVFAPTANYNGPASFTYTVASGGVTETATVNVTVNSVNDGPVNTAPGAQTTAEDSALVFSSANGNALTVADVDGGSLTTTVAVTNGTLTLGSNAGVTVSGNGTGSVQLTGTAAAINAALNGSAFSNTADYNGAATLTVTTSDGAASDIDSVALTVSAVADIANDSASVNEDSSVAVSVLANDTFEGAGRVISAVNGSAITAGGAAVAVANGTVTLNASGQLVFAPTANYNGPASFTYTVASGGVTETATVNVTVGAVNDGPVNTTPGAQTTAEDSPLVFSSANGNALTVADVDGGSLTTTLAVTQGTLTLGSTAGVTVSGNGTGSIQITGTAAAINAALNGTAFIGTADYNGAATLTVTTTDGVASDVDSIALTVTAVADVANDSVTINEDSPVAISVLANDSFEGAGRVISAVNGSAITAGGAAVAVANGSVTLNVAGQLVFAPTANYNGPASFTYTVASGGVTETATVNVTVNAVNDGPVNTTPGAQTVAEDTSLVFSSANGNAVTVADVDGGTLTTTLAVTHGTLSLGSTAGVTVSGNGTGSVQVTGSAAAINAALNGTAFTNTADYNGAATLTVTTSDGAASDIDSVGLTISAVADIANDVATVNEDSSVAVSVLANDTFEGAGRVISAVNGSAITVGGAAVAVTNGSVSLNAAGQLVFAPTADYNDGASFTYTVTSGGVTETATVNVTVNSVNDGPVNTTPGAQTTAEDSPLVFSVANGNAITVADVDGGSLTTTIAVTHGALTLGSTTGVTVSGNGTGSVQITGTAAAINAALNGTVFNNTGDFNGAATLTLTTSDGAASDIDSVALTVSAVVDITNDSASVNEDSSVAISVLANDSFESAGRAITAINGSAITAGGAAVAVINGSVTLNVAGQLVFAPTANYNGSASFTYTVASGGVTETATVNVTVNSINDGPVNAAPGAQTTTEDGPLVFSSANGTALTVADVDGGTLTTTVAVTNGTLSLGSTAGVSVVGNGSGSVQITGTATAINAALNGTAFSNTADYNGAATLTVTTSDGAASDIDSVALTITAVADIANDSATVNEDSSVAVSVLANDTFEGAGRVISAVNGNAITAGGAAVAVTNGSVSLNAAGQLVFAPTANYNGSASFTYTVASGGVTETATVNVTVNSVNDGPVNSAPGAQTTAEDSPLVFSGANGNALTVADVDGGTLTTTVAVTNGTLSLGSTASVTVSGNGTGSVQITGTAAAINAALNGTAFTNTADYNGEATLTVTTSDGAASDIDSVALTVTTVADIANDSASTNEDSSVAISVLANDSFEGAGRVISAVNGSVITAGGAAVAVANGSVTLNAAGQLVFAPTANYNGPASFTYTVSSGGVTETATVNVTIGAVNDGPVNTTPGAQTAAEDSALTFSSSNGNALSVADVDGGTLTTTLAVTHGTLTLGSTAGVTVTGNGTGSVQITGTAAAINAALNGTAFTNTADYNGTATLTMTTSDGAASDIDSVALTVSAVTDIANDSATVNEDSSVAISVLANDTFEGAGRTITEVNGSVITTGGSSVAVANGTVTLNAAGQLVFTPTANYNGPASFTYTVASGGVTETATVNVTVNSVNDGPVNTTPGAQTTAEDSALVFSSANGNALSVADVDGGSLTTTVAITNGTLTLGSTAGVTVSGNGTGSVQITGTAAAINAALNGTTFTNTADYNGAATLTLTTSDGAASDIDSVALTVTAVTDIANDSAITNEDSSVVISVLTNDSFEGAGRVISAVNGSAITAGGAAVAVTNGTVTLNAAGQLSFTPTANYNGPASFTYTVASGGVTETATVNLTVNPANDGPVARADVGSTTEDSTLTVSAANGVLQSAVVAAGRDSDVEGDTLLVSGITFGSTPGVVGSALAGAYGSLTLNADGSYSYAPGAAAQALDSGESRVEVFTYTVSDGNGGTATTTLSITVTGANDAPQLVADVGSTPEDTPVSGNVLANDSDVDVETLSVTQFTVAGVGGTFAAGQTATITGVGTLTLSGTGAYSFTPVANYNGAVPVATYTVSDGSTTANGTLTLAVTPVNDAPIVASESATTPEDTPLSGNVLANDSDIDSGALSVAQFSVAGMAGSFSAGQVATITGVGTLSIAANGGYTFTPAANYSGTAPVVTYTVSDGAGGAATATLNLTVTSVVDTPSLVVASGTAALVSSVGSWESAANSNSTSEQLTANSLDGWTRVDSPDVFAGGTNAIEVWANGDSQQRQDGNSNIVVASAGNGDNFVELNNASSMVQTLGVSQQVSTVAGMVYQLSLDYAGRPGFSADFTRIGVYLDGVLIQQFAATSPMGYADWHNLQFSFAGDGATHTLTISTDATQFNAAGRGAFIDDPQIIGLQGVVAGNAGGGATTSVGLAGYVNAALPDADGSESLALTFSGVPAGAVIVTSAHPGGVAASGGSITIAGSELASAQLQFGASVTGHVSLGVVATSTEVANGSITATASAPLEFDVLPAFTSSNLAGDGLTNIIGTTGSETLNGGNGAEYLLGRAGNDSLNGGGGSDVLDGGTGNDSLNAGSGSDVLYGGAGDDALTGGSGADVFRWTLADRGTPGSAANDTVADFSTGAGGDSLHLGDLLVGENAGNLDNYLHFSSVGTGTVVQISATGGFAAGFNTGAIDQTITLQNVDLGAAGTLNTQQIIDQLLANGNLKING